MTRTLTIKGPSKSIRNDLGLEGIPIGRGGKELEDFADFLGKCISLIPEKRLTVQEALQHPFLRTN